MHFGNCRIYARREYRRRMRLWLAAGKPKHLKPWIKRSPSILAPPCVQHEQVGGMGEPSMEFVPLDARRLPWWKLPVVLLFHGRVRPAEFPHTQPSEHGDLT